MSDEKRAPRFGVRRLDAALTHMHPKAILQAHGLRPRRALGQNFLVDDAALHAIAARVALLGAAPSSCHPFAKPQDKPDERSEEGSPQSPDRWGDPSRRLAAAQDDKEGDANAARGGPRGFLDSRDAIHRVSTTAGATSFCHPERSPCHPDEQSEEGSPHDAPRGEILRSLPDDKKKTMAHAVLEWGPGLGALTRHLLEQGLRVHAVDVDECLLGLLRHRFAPFVEQEMLRLHHGDARTFDVQSVIKSEEELWSAAARRRFPLSDSPLKQSDAGAEARRRSPSGQLVLCGNLPYNIASRLLVRSVELARYVRAAVYLVQKEVAQRVCASGGKAYGLLSVLVQVRFQTRLLRTVPAGAFWPVPKVDAAVVELIPRPEQEQPRLEWGEFKALARTAFAQRRKKLGNALACLRGAGEAFRRADIDPSLRAEQLTPTDFARLHHALAK